MKRQSLCEVRRCLTNGDGFFEAVASSVNEPSVFLSYLVQAISFLRLIRLSTNAVLPSWVHRDCV